LQLGISESGEAFKTSRTQDCGDAAGKHTAAQRADL